ncbi:ribosomal protection-like ABC-F family protein [Pseudalkalibacillus hwajinpoensis]|uniref:ribosomal protection-like ABC-F family protein n=1 Tax=Guptibacillus hwajinpoensis TaxID=208199 RepID=UPI001CD54EF8|nr:ABC-F type ribosomal protection protein [Pseudalkalibacillus hwajinpoensis]MCA0993384.1 ABC-F type ribosomal protection protein [Pseudalkalibacillus hwajinpoensis]
MARVIQVKELQKSFGEREILSDVNFEIRNGEKIGLVGWNGAGKSTLVNILMKRIEPDRGSVTIPHVNIGYLPQSTDNHLAVDAELFGERLLEQSKKLGFQKERWEQENLQHLSGGEKLKFSLAKIWASSPEFLILDEPTNHLDMQGVKWLSEEVRSYSGAALIISHDRYFLDETVTKIFELEFGKLTIYDGNYSFYRHEKQRRTEQNKRDYEKQQRKVEVIEQQISTLKDWSAKGHREAGKGGSQSENRQMGLREFERAKAKKKDNQIKSKLKRLNLELKKDGVEKPKEEKTVSFQFEPASKRGKRVLEAKGIKKEFGDRLLFDNSHFYIKHGERIGLIGSNGTGKTTFIKLLLEQEKLTKGSLWISESTKVAYLSQDVTDLPGEKTPLDYLNLSNRQQETKARTLLSNMGISQVILGKTISQLSLGERTRLKLIYMILMDYDFLILDEPTNHLDLPSREELERTLSTYTGTLLIVSHDRYVIEKLCTKLLVIENGQMKRVEVGIKEYEEKHKNKETGSENVREELAVLETKMTELLGKISYLAVGTEEYKSIDKELMKLMDLKRKINSL